MCDWLETLDNWAIFELHGDPGGKLSSNPTSLKEIERAAVLQALIKCEWKQKDAAVQLGISEVTMHRMMKRHKIKRPDWCN